MALPPPPRQRNLIGFDDEPPPAAKAVASPPVAAADPLISAESATPFGGAVPCADLKDRTVYVVDAHSLIYQVYHALPEMTGARGQPVGATYGFARDLLILLRDRKPDYLFCAFDLPGPTFRHHLYAEYKANRAEMPLDLRPQIADIRRMLEVLDIPVLSCPSYEADDVLATMARLVSEAGGHCVLVTNDKDCRQLITERVTMLHLRKNQFFDADALQAEWGIAPEQVVDFQSLVGDTADHIPGVPLIGPKLAGALLRQFGNCETILAHADQISGVKRRENLLQARDQVILNRQLVRLNDQVPISVTWRGSQDRRVDGEQLQALFVDFGFRGLAQDWGAMSGHDRPTEAAWQIDYHQVTSLDELTLLAQEMSQQERLSVDTETTHRHPRWAELVGYALAWQPGRAYYVPVRAPAGERALDAARVREILRPVLENPAIGKVGHNLKYDQIVLRGAGIALQGVAFDSMIASYLLEAGERSHSLDESSRRYLNHETIKIDEILPAGQTMDQVPLSAITPYAAEDADVALRLAPLLHQRLGEENLLRLLEDVELPLIDVLAEMEHHGIRVDAERLRTLSVQYGERMEGLEREIHALAGGPFNVASPKQLAEVLFQRLHLPVIKKNRTGPSTDMAVLEELASQHPLPAKIVEYRQYAKLKSTYVDALPQLVHPQTGRIHSSFHQGVAATGRLSSSDPNLQNIPVRTEEGREIRSAFLPCDANHRLLAADYSQIELRVLAHFCGDGTLREAFEKDQDIHARVASQVYQVPLEQVTGDMRRRAKAINFGIIYGQSPFGLARSLGIEQEEAAAFIEAYFAQTPGVDAFFQSILAQCHRNGYVTTILGRRRKVQGVRNSSQTTDTRQRNLSERTAINTVIQGSAADLIKLAMLRVHRRMIQEKTPARLLLQIHDELVFEVPADDVTSFASLVVDEMTHVGNLSVPLKVDVKTGLNWAECEPLV